ncbi:unnamed protein product [Aspergillus niger]|nr:unnamed protein product [Aspergillus niger]
MAVNFPWIYPVRVIQAIFGIIVLALTAYYISWFAYSSDSPNFMLFVACWTAFIATPYLALAPVFFPQLAHRIVIPAVEVITMIFWFAGFIALAVFLPPAEACHWSRCSALQAATVFGALEWYDSPLIKIAIFSARAEKFNSGTISGYFRFCCPRHFAYPVQLHDGSMIHF